MLSLVSTGWVSDRENGVLILEPEEGREREREGGGEWEGSRERGGSGEREKDRGRERDGERGGRGG